VLALDIMDQGRTERLLVPGTENLSAESPAALHYDRQSHTTFVLWQGLINGLHPFLHLAGYNGQAWSEPLDITGNVFADKGSAELVILTEPELNKESQLLESATNRAVIYVAWQEVTPVETQNYLVPIILQNGVYLGWHESFRLSSLVPNDPETRGSLSRPDAGLENLLRIQPSTKDQAVLLGFTDPDTGRVVTLEIEVLPQALSVLAARVETLILQYAQNSKSLKEIADKLRVSILQYNQDFHRSTLDYLADQIEALLLEHSSIAAAVAPGMLEKFGLHITHIGSRVRAKGLIGPEVTEIIKMGQTRAGGGPFHHLKVSIVANREGPLVGGPAVLFLSSTGLEALVAWEEEEGIAFRETEGADWGERQMVGLSGDLTKQEVYRILADRTLDR